MKSNTLLTLLAIFYINTTSWAQIENPVKSFIIDNNIIELTFEKTPTTIELASIKDKRNNSSFEFQNQKGFLSDTLHKIQDITLNKTAQNLNELVIEYDSYTLKTIIKTYNNAAIVAFDYYIKTKTRNLNFTPKTTELFSFDIAQANWQGESIEFFDQTDHTNELVLHHKFSPRDTLKGNILTLFNKKENKSLFLLKESPTVVAQLYYPGHDFKINKNHIKVCGAGISNKDLNSKEWTKTYSVVFGFADNNETNLLKTLRAYQKESRKYNSHIDDMIMMNTWGDRNRDARISEEFILKELKYAANLGITHYQIDDGWQQGLSKNSANPDGNVWDLWKKEEWQAHAKRFPNGLEPVIKEAKKQGIKLGLWFHPSNYNNYENWEQDAEIVTQLFKKYSIQYFKIDGVKLKNKQ
ncbi:MAG: alpha-galactosidase [Rhodothermaceae bacterium]